MKLILFLPMALIGAVMTGGLGSRMKQDKGLLLKGDVTWVERSAKVLGAVCESVVLSMRAAQIESYEKMVVGIPRVTDCFTFSGPLNGILSVHRQFLTSDLLVVATDYPMLETDTLSLLIASHSVHPNQPSMLSNDGQAHPLLAIYPAVVLRQLASIENQNAKLPSLQAIMRAHNAREVAVSSGQVHQLRNCNFPSDI